MLRPVHRASLVAVGGGLVRAGLLDADVVGLLGRELRQLGAELAEVQLGDLLVSVSDPHSNK